MAELKTKLNDADPYEFLDSVEDPKRKSDAFAVTKIMEEITGEKPKMWGGSIIGFDSYHYRYKSGQEGDWMKIGLSPRKTSLTLYLSYGYENNKEIMDRLGKYKTGKACLYLKKLEDIDLDVLKELIQTTYENIPDEQIAK